jgi:ABC-2 type transport system permease protein
MSVATDGQLEAKRYGPDAFGDDLRRFVNLTVTLASTDFKLIYFGSVLGYLWSLVRPLLFFSVLYLVFTKLFKVGNGVPDYAVELLIAIILWTFFLQATSGCVQCLLGREGLLRKMRFPRLVIPLAVALTALFQLATNLVPIIIFALASGVYPKLSWLELIPVITLLAMLASGLGMLLSVLFVRFRDIQPIWDVTSQILFYASPIIYPVYYYSVRRGGAGPARTFTLHGLESVLMASPIASLIAQARYALVGLVPLPSPGLSRSAATTLGMHSPGVNPSAAYALGGWVYVLIPVGISVFVFVLGIWFFNREAPRISENL